MLPLFDYASIIIPPQYHAHTPVRIAATAGMRLLSLEDQSRVYDALYEGLVEQIPPMGQFTFTGLRRENVYTLNGEREGFFGAVAANYLRGVIDAELKVIVHPDDEEEIDGTADAADQAQCTNKFGMCEQDAENIVFGPSRHYVPQTKHDVRAHGPLGALDMGGSSTQIVFHGVKRDDVPSHLHDDEFFSVSYLSFGADQFRLRLWDLWVHDTKQNTSQDTIVGDRNVILNPCSFVGYEIEYKGHVLLGTGNSVECSEQVNRLIPHHDNHIDLDRLYDENQEQKQRDLSQPKKKLQVGGVEHPPVRGKFFGMSLYFFTLDCLRELSDPDHPIHVSILFHDLVVMQ
jgi:hypothetical protein